MLAVAKGSSALSISLASRTERMDALLLTVAPSVSSTNPVVIRWSQVRDASEGSRWHQVNKGETAILEIAVASSMVIRIPVRDGRFLLDSASVPAGGRLQRVDLN